MKIIAIVLIISGLVTIFVPSFYTCQAHGKAIQLPGGKSIPMKCLWTARAEIGMGVLLLAVGIFLFLSRTLESRRFFPFWFSFWEFLSCFCLRRLSGSVSILICRVSF